MIFIFNLKIWFQNRRRKDTLLSQGKLPSGATITKSLSTKRGKSSDDSEHTNEEEFELNSSEEYASKRKRVVDNNVIEGVLYQLKAHQNAPSRLSSKRTSLNTESSMQSKSRDNNSSLSVKEDSQNKIIINPSLQNQNGNIIQENLGSIPKVLSNPSILVNNSKENSYQTNDSSYTDCSKSSTLSSSSLLTSTSSSSSSSSSSSLSSDEETQDYYKSKFQTLNEPYSIKDYVTNKYYNQSYPVYNHYQPSTISYSNQQAVVYQTSPIIDSTNKVNQSWALYNQAYVNPSQTQTNTTADSTYYYNSGIPFTNNYNFNYYNQNC